MTLFFYLPLIQSSIVPQTPDAVWADSGCLGSKTAGYTRTQAVCKPIYRMPHFYSSPVGIQSNLRRYALASLFSTLLWIATVGCQPSGTEVAPASRPAALEATVAVKWIDLFLTVERFAPGFRPPVAARALGYINLAAYEAVVPGSTSYQSVARQLPGLEIPSVESGKAYQWDIVVNETYHALMVSFFPHVTEVYKKQIETLYQQLAVSSADAEVQTRSKKFGQAIAAAVYRFSRTDKVGDEGYLNNQPTSYVPPVGPGLWQPTFPDYGRALLPYWGKVRTFAASESDKIARPPLPYSTSVTSPMYTQGLEVYSSTTPLSREKQWIGEFWSDDITTLTFEPAARWFAIAQQVIQQEKVPLDKAIYTYAKLGMGLNDAGVACWNSKYLYNTERPVSYIRRAVDPRWQSKLTNPITSLQGITPPFPSYPSGHSCFGGAAAEVLTDVFGSAYAMTDRCHEGRTEFMGTPRSFGSFYEMATENAYSRIPLGVHFRMDCEEGLRMGYVIGRRVNQLAWKR